MKEFTIPEFVRHIAALSVAMPMAEHHALERAASIVEKEAKDLIGHEHDFWPPLAESTLERKAANTPLLETGEMRDSIEHVVVSHKEAHVGSNNDKAVYHELGTSRIPPRPFLGRAAMRKADEIAELVGREMHAHLIGSKP